MSLGAVNRYVQPEFSEMVDRFLARHCTVGIGLSISDKTLFPVFRTFWTHASTETQHPALHGQFRVELAQRGFRSNGAKRPRWYGLTLHQLTLTLLNDEADLRSGRPYVAQREMSPHSFVVKHDTLEDNMRTFPSCLE